MADMGGCAAARHARIPYVLSPRGMVVKDLIARRSRLAKSAWIRLTERSNLEQAAALHLTSQLEETEIERFGWQLPRLIVIPNAIDTRMIMGADEAALVWLWREKRGEAEPEDLSGDLHRAAWAATQELNVPTTGATRADGSPMSIVEHSAIAWSGQEHIAVPPSPKRWT